MTPNSCPIHKRPFVRGICGPCRKEGRRKPAQAPPVAVAELPPVPDSPVDTPAKTPPVAVVAPARADGKPVKRSEIPPEVRRQIEESLATAPTLRSETSVATVETSGGIKTVKIKSDSEPTDIADDAVSE